jgi:hypothetical protein
MSGREEFEDLGLDVRIILMWIFKKYGGGIALIDLALVRGKWRDCVKAVMNFWVP